MVECFFAQSPIINFKVFRDVSFTTGNIVMFFAFLNLFASIVLLPIYLQGIMGYTATMAGKVLGLGGIATLFTMPVVGVLINKINPKWPMAAGILIASGSTYLLSQLNLYVDFNTVFLPRVLLGIGMGLLFIPLTTMTMSGIRREDMGNAAGIYNLLRNVGGSVGVAFVMTMVSRHSQRYQLQLTEHLSPFDRSYQMAASYIAGMLRYQGYGESASAVAADGIIYGQTLRQAAVLAFNDTAYVIFVVMLCVLPLVLIMKRGKAPTQQGLH
ncbi:EmrB/QacA family drug resistance transporter [Candidatus Magnetobacterium bavaricum]|uniref:EmrB/QacA family drug resistance transporter n=1 Tax=Candidatus Magnetobacterium bavaricum TaxID=29290 RepID=A0A0F3GYE7_9BACT|nr:EmrB/QacA family drug resistance transporter [Candidatus Magnetobacterium bavaricum]